MKRAMPTLLLAAALIGSLGLAPAGQTNTVVYEGLTSASDTRKLGFDIRGVVGKVEVKKNQKVKAGEPLISLDDREERARLDFFKKRADTSLQIAEAEETFKIKKIDYERKLQLFTDGKAATEFEVKTAEAEMNIAKIRIEQARHEGEVATAEMISQQMKVDRMVITAPIDGEISDVIVKAGEQVDESKPVLEIVNLTELYIDLTLVPSHLVKGLQLGQTVPVRYIGENSWRQAKVDAIDLSIDRRSATHPFRLVLPNPEHRYPGDRIEVQMPDSGVADAQR